MKREFAAFKKGTPAVVSAQQISEYCEDNARGMPWVVKANAADMDLGFFIRSNKKRIEDLLPKYGAILFSGFAVSSIDQFHQTVLAFGNEMLDYQFGSTPRTELNKKVYTSTEYPADQFIPMHNEMSYTNNWPSKIWFFCEQPSVTGGETPIADSHRVYEKIPAHIRELFGRSGVRYVRNYHESVDVPWQKVFRTEDPREVEAYCRQHGLAYQWINESLRTWQTCQSTLVHEPTKKNVWFNQAHLFHVSMLPGNVQASLRTMFQDVEMPRNSYLGDGTAISPEHIAAIQAAYEEMKIPLRLLKHDVLLLDNERVAHGRHPYTGERKVRVAMTR